MNGYPVNCDNKVTNLIMSVGEIESFSVAQIIVFEYIVLIFMSDGVADHVTATYCSVKCVMFHFVGYFIVYRSTYSISDLSSL